MAANAGRAEYERIVKQSEDSMNLEMIRDLHGYDRWANEHILETCEPLTTEEFVREEDIPWGSVRNQLVHQFIVHKRWLSWVDDSLTGEEAYALQADPVDYPDLRSVRDMWLDVLSQTEQFLKRATCDDLERVLSVEWPGGGFALPAGQVMIHIACHSMQHRTETAVALTRLGHSPGDVDYLFFALERQAAPTD